MSPSTCEMHALGHSAVGEVWRCHGCGRFQLRLPDASLHLGADAFEELFELVVLARARARQATLTPSRPEGAPAEPAAQAPRSDDDEGLKSPAAAWWH